VDKKAVNEVTASFVEWVTLTQDALTENELERVMAHLEPGREPTPYVPDSGPVKRGPNLDVGDIVRVDPSKTPDVNKAAADIYAHQVGTVEKVGADFLLIKFESGPSVKFLGTTSGSKTGLYRHTPMADIAEKTTGGKGKIYEAVYFSKPGDVSEYRKFVVDQYKGKETASDTRLAYYYSGPLVNYKITKDGDLVVTLMAQGRPYPVTLNAKKGRLLYIGAMGKRPSGWERGLLAIAQQKAKEGEAGE